MMVTGAAGVIGSEICEAAQRLGRPDLQVVPVGRRPADRSGWVVWDIGRDPLPAALKGHWDVVVHAAASTRWTMTRQEATAANVAPLEQLLPLCGPGTRLVHVSTAYAARPGTDGPGTDGPGAFEGFRNGYEWSKARCEDVVREWGGDSVIVRPPLVLGRQSDGRISRFSGPYTLLQCLVSGLAAVVVGEPGGYAEIAPVDLVAETAVKAALATLPPRRIETISAGRGCLQLQQLLDISLDAINTWRASHGLAEVAQPPFMNRESWHRFFLPLARQHLSPVQAQTVDLLGMFEAYTSMAEPFEPTVVVADPQAVLRASIAHWIAVKPRLARRDPAPWTLVAETAP